MEAKKGLEIVTGIVREEIARRGEIRLKVGSNSMYPFINRGEWIVVTPCSIENLRIGDIVLCEDDHHLYVHRLVYRISRGGKRKLITKGDNGRDPDTPFSEYQFLGKVVRVENKDWGMDLQTAQARIGNKIAGIVSLLEGLMFRTARYIRKCLCVR